MSVENEPHASHSIVQLKNVTKRIGKKTIIDNLTLDIPRGQVFGLLGPNGAGKTTTIRMIVGLMRISKGEIRINGQSVSENYEAAIRFVGAIVENPEMYKFLTGYQNLVHYARMIPGVTKERIDEVIALVGLKNRINEKVKTYSLGMRQRLGVAQAILHKPELLILDEPTNGLDPAGIRELRDYLRTLAANENTTVVVSSHLLTEMELMCDRVAIIQNGKLIDVRNVKDEANNGLLAIPVHFEVDQTELAVTVITREIEGSVPETTGAWVQVSLTRDHIAMINKRLVEAGINVYGIRTTAKSLEDQFLEMTGSEQIG